MKQVVLDYIASADGKRLRELSQAIGIRQAVLASGKVTTTSVYKPVEDHPTNKPL